MKLTTAINLLVACVSLCILITGAANTYPMSLENEEDGEVDVIDIDEEMELLDPTPSTLQPTEQSEPSLHTGPNSSNDNGGNSEEIIANNTRCTQTVLSFRKETLLHVWEIKGLIGYISYIKRFEQPFEVKTDQVSFKSDNVDGKWSFKVHQVRHRIPYALRSLTSKGSVSASAASAGYSDSGSEVGDVRIVVTYAYEAKQPRNIDFILTPTIIHGGREIALPPKKSTSPTIIQQKFYNTRGYQLNSNFLEYVYTFTWSNIIEHLDNIKRSLYNLEVDKANPGSETRHLPQKQQPTNYAKSGSGNIDIVSEELFEEITKTDVFGHFGDITIKFAISAFVPEDPISTTSSRCNASLIDFLSNNLLEKLTSSKRSSKTHPDGGSSRLDLKQQTFLGQGIPPYMRYMYSMLHDDRFADVLLVVGDVEIPAHRIILATSSPVFSAILDNLTSALDDSNSASTPGENHTDCHSPSHEKVTKNLPRIIIEPKDIGVDSLQELLRYIYTGTVDTAIVRDGSVAHRLIIIAERYGLPELKRHCEAILLQGLSVDNAIDMYLLGSKVSADKLTRKAMIIMKLHKDKIVTQSEVFRELSLRHPTLMYDLFLSN